MLDSSFTSIVNAYLKADSEAAAGLDEIEGRRIKVHIRELDLTRCLEIEDRQIFVTTAADQTTVDSSIDISLAAVRNLLTGQNALDMAKENRISIDGDTHIISVLQRVLKSVEIDWEEWLSQHLGDTVTHGVATVVHAGVDFGQRLRETLKQSVREYIFEEKKIVPATAEVEEFISEVDKIRADTDRLEARFQNLLQSHRKS